MNKPANLDIFKNNPSISTKNIPKHCQKRILKDTREDTQCLPSVFSESFKTNPNQKTNPSQAQTREEATRSEKNSSVSFHPQTKPQASLQIQTRSRTDITKYYQIRPKRAKTRQNTPKSNNGRTKKNPKNTPNNQKRPKTQHSKCHRPPSKPTFPSFFSKSDKFHQSNPKKNNIKNPQTRKNVTHKNRKIWGNLKLPDGFKIQSFC